MFAKKVQDIEELKRGPRKGVGSTNLAMLKNTWREIESRLCEKTTEKYTVYFIFMSESWPSG